MTSMKDIAPATPEQTVKDLIRLRNELKARAWVNGKVYDMTLVEVVWKINSCLGYGYPRRLVNKDSE